MIKAALFFLSIVLIIISCQSTSQKEADSQKNKSAQTFSYDSLIWSDEFDGSGVIDTTKWFHQTRIPDHGEWWGGIIQHYTDREDNSFLEDGYLHLAAKREEFEHRGFTKQYTSARLNSKFAFTYGKVDVRAKLPSGVGTWPAIWMLNTNISEKGAYWEQKGYGTTSWPKCGEIDIMEHWGKNQNFIASALHNGSSYGDHVLNMGGRQLEDVSNSFHIYSLEWTPDKMVFKIDGIEHYSYNPEMKNTDTWPYDANYYFIFNIAIERTVDPAFEESEMVVDYIRVYQ